MYVPRYHQVKDPAEVWDYIRQNGFGTLVSSGDGGIHASHIPFHLIEKDGDHYLSCHISKANEQQLSFRKNEEVLAIFMNTHAYVSSSWYDHVNVPTWNYVAVHVYGEISVMEGEDLITALRQMVHQYEDGRPERFQLEDMDDAMLKAHISGLVGYEIKISRIEAAHKLSQNRNDVDYKNVVSKLENEGANQDIVSIMKEQRKDIF